MSNPLFSEIEDIAKRARSASLALAMRAQRKKNDALEAIARGIESNRNF